MKKQAIAPSPLFRLIRQRLKANGLTYRDVAQALGVAEISIKRWITQENLTIGQLTTIAELFGQTAVELMQDAEEPYLRQMTLEQEQEIAEDVRLMLVTACALRYWTLEDIVEVYDLTEEECIDYLRVLERIRVIDLLPKNRIRLRMARDFGAIPDGPLQHYFRGRIQQSFFSSDFKGPHEQYRTFRATLTPAAISQFGKFMNQIRLTLDELHKESRQAPLKQRIPFFVCFAYRDWELEEFSALRRVPRKAE